MTLQVIFFISPQKDILPYSFYLGKVCTNNAAEYEALIMGLELALKFKIRHIEIFGDSELVIKQMTTEYEVRHEGLAMYHDLAQRLFECFPDASITHVPRKDNAIADALANLGSSIPCSRTRAIPIIRVPESIITAHHLEVRVHDLILDWRFPLIITVV